MRLATFNIKHGELRGLSAIEQVLREADADVVGLQEVDAGTARSGGIDQARALGEALAMEWAFAKSMDHDGGAYGCALLLRSTLLRGRPLAAKGQALPGGSGPGEEPRVLLSAQAGDLRIFVTHLDLPAKARLPQAAAIAKAIGDPRGALLLCDANEPVSEPALRKLLALPLRDAWAEAGAQERPTAPSDRPQQRIDHVLLGAGLPRAHAAAALDTDASDHPLIVVDL
jgi:endonuclease/exonuclease/phosphatase family metal-dependent hydrolase